MLSRAAASEGNAVAASCASGPSAGGTYRNDGTKESTPDDGGEATASTPGTGTDASPTPASVGSSGAADNSRAGASMTPRSAARNACDNAQNTRASLRKRISRLVGCTLTSISAGAMDKNNAATGWRPGGTTS